MSVELELATLTETPPNQFRYRVPETGYLVKSYDATTFFNAYSSHCKANQIPLAPNWKEVLIDLACKQNATEWHTVCRRVGKNKPRKGIPFAAAMQFLNVVKEWAKNTLGGESAFVPQEEANARALTCTTCPFNTQKIVWGCGSCMSAFIKGVFAIIGKRTTPYDNSLGGCALCGCALKVSVHVPLAPQQSALDEATKKSFRDVSTYCWKSSGL